MREDEELVRIMARAGVNKETAVYLPQILGTKENISQMLKIVKQEPKTPTDEQWYLTKAMEIQGIKVPTAG